MRIDPPIAFGAQVLYPATAAVAKYSAVPWDFGGQSGTASLDWDPHGSLADGFRGFFNWGNPQNIPKPWVSILLVTKMI